MTKVSKLLESINSLKESSIKVGDKVEIQDTVSHKKHGQHSYKGEIGRVTSISKGQAKVSIDDAASDELTGMGYETPEVTCDLEDLKKV